MRVEVQYRVGVELTYAGMIVGKIRKCVLYSSLTQQIMFHIKLLATSSSCDHPSSGKSFHSLS
jgi:hypothetical protein